MNAPYNPRKIKDEARRRLKANIGRVGLLEPIIWNSRTGHVVGGHQRLKALDSLEGTDNYLVPVAVVDLDETTERAQNVFLNNSEAQGEWDIGQLGELLKSIPEPEMTGFDMGDLYQIFGLAPGVTPDAGDVMPTPSPAIVEKYAEKKQADHTKFRDVQAKDNVAREQGDFFLVVLFTSDEERTAFTTKYKLPDNRYVDSGVLVRAMTGGDDDQEEAGKPGQTQEA